jgi:two-component system CheB/CheR fusion protein
MTNHKDKKQHLPKSLPAAETIKDTPYIIAIGASAGGLETLKIFFMHSAPNEHIAFIVITHLSPDHVSILPELLQQYTPINVLTISNRQEVQGNHIYVLPPGKKVAIQQGVLELMDQVRIPYHPKLPIDFFLSSLAKDQGEKVICIILSGMGHDGTLGLRALREHGGLVIAQTVKSALYDAMPKSAIDSGLVDYILEPEEMYAFILKYIAHLNDKTIAIEKNISVEMQQILSSIKHQTGHDFSLYKPNTISRRIQKRLDILQISSLSDYIFYLHHHPMEINILFKELLINVTNFFRDPEAFDVLKKQLLDKILNNKSPGSDLRIWIPGCSTGEEAYSIAMIIYECMHDLKCAFNVQIFGTDIDEDAIEVARAGLFPQSIRQDITPERLERFFVIDHGLYKISPDIRKMIIFALQNIIKDPPFTKLDLLSCRNLLIYLSAKLQKRILPLLHYSLKTNGLLFLGTSETLGGSADFFSIINKKWNIFQRKQGSSSFKSTRYVPSQSQLSEIISEKITEKNMTEIEPSLSNLIKNILLKYYTPACVVVDEKGTIVYVYGRTSRFLEFAPGEARLLFLDMIRPELKSKIHSAIVKATTQKKEVIINNLQLKTQNEIKYVHVKVRPLIETELFKGKLVLIIFEEMLMPLVEQPDKTTGRKNKLGQLEQELKYTKENLQTTIEELETSNEELKSSNEELQSTNEELQSTNEEIETSKEELQSLNEELSTVNAELENRIEQLSSANDDIKNLLDNTEIATIFLDKNLCIKRFTPKATEIVNLISTDVGRPLGHIVSNLTYEDLVDDARTVLKTLEPISNERVDKTGHWYVIRIIPYRTITDTIDGVVITFLNIHAQKKAETKLNRIEKDILFMNEVNGALLDTISNPALLLDKNEKVFLVNDEFLHQFKIKKEELIGYSLFESKLHWSQNSLNSLLGQIGPKHPLIEQHQLHISSDHLITISARLLGATSILLTVN